MHTPPEFTGRLLEENEALRLENEKLRKENEALRKLTDSLQDMKLPLIPSPSASPLKQIPADYQPRIVAFHDGGQSDDAMTARP